MLVVADHLPEGWHRRLDVLGVPPVGVQPLAWSPEEWAAGLARGNAIAREAAEHGSWLIAGSGPVPEEARSRGEVFAEADEVTYAEKARRKRESEPAIIERPRITPTQVRPWRYHGKGRPGARPWCVGAPEDR